MSEPWTQLRRILFSAKAMNGTEVKTELLEKLVAEKSDKWPSLSPASTSKHRSPRKRSKCRHKRSCLSIKKRVTGKTRSLLHNDAKEAPQWFAPKSIQLTTNQKVSYAVSSEGVKLVSTT